MFLSFLKLRDGKLCFLVPIPLDLQIPPLVPAPVPPRASPSPFSSICIYYYLFNCFNLISWHWTFRSPPLVPAPIPPRASPSPLGPLRYGAAGALGDLLARQCVVSRGLSFLSRRTKLAPSILGSFYRCKAKGFKSRVFLLLLRRREGKVCLRDPRWGGREGGRLN